MSQIQDMVDGTANAGILSLRSGEFEGPLRIARPITIEAAGATFWARQGPVLVLESEDVVLRNLRVEVTAPEGADDADERVALKVLVRTRITLDQVVVRGAVQGLPGEADEWAYPDHLAIGRVAARRLNEYLLRVEVPVSCQVTSAISGLTLLPHALRPGVNDIFLSFNDIPSDTLVVGQVLLRSAFLTRVIGVSANTMSGSKEPPAATAPILLWEPPNTGRGAQQRPARQAPATRSPEPPGSPIEPPVSKPSVSTSKASPRKRQLPLPTPTPAASTPSPASRYVTSERPLGGAFTTPPPRVEPNDVRQVEANGSPAAPAEVAVPPSQRVSVAALGPLFTEPPSFQAGRVPESTPLFSEPSTKVIAAARTSSGTDNEAHRAQDDNNETSGRATSEAPRSADDAASGRQQKRPLLSSLFMGQQERDDATDETS